MPQTNEQLKAKNLARARKQVDFFRKELDENRDRMQELKMKQDQAFDKGKELAKQYAEALEYLQDLEQEPNL